MRVLLVAALCWVCCNAQNKDSPAVVSAAVPAIVHVPNNITDEEPPVGCVCGVFLNGQFKKGSRDQPSGFPAFLHEHSDIFPCNPTGNKLCTNKCLDQVKLTKSTINQSQIFIFNFK